MRSLTLGLAATVAMSASQASAAFVSYEWSVIITQIGQYKPLLPGMQGVQVGDKAIVTFTLNTSIPDIYQSPQNGGYPNGAISVRFRIPRIGYVYSTPDAMLEVTDSAPSGFDTLRIEKVIPGLNANFLIWLRSTDPSSVASQAVPLAIEPQSFDYTRYIGFYGTDGIPSAILGGDPTVLTDCPADLNDDDLVEDADFSLFAQAYDTLDCFDSAMAWGCPADFNYDGLVDDGDFTTFVVAYDALVCR